MADNGEIAALDFKQSVKKEDYANNEKNGVLYFMVPAFNTAWGYGGLETRRVLPERLPTWDRYAFFSRRDLTLMATPYYESMWANAIAVATTKAAAWGWEIESSIPLRRKRAQELLQQSTAGVFVGYVPFISAHLRGFFTTGKAVVEIERETSAYSSRVRALHHLNPLRCRFTDDPTTPVLYMDRKGKVHELKYWQVMLFGDNVDPTEGEYGLVESAAQRAYSRITLTAAVFQYLYEKVTGKRALSLEFIQGLTRQTMEDAINSSENEQSRRGAMLYKGVIAVPIPGDVPVTRVSIPLAEVPDGFDPQMLRDDAYIIYAGAIGLDVNDLDPRLAARQTLGSGAQSIILAQKSAGRGLAGWQPQWTANVNMWALDTATTFRWSEPNLDDEIKKAQAKQTRTQIWQAQIEAGIITVDQARNLAVDEGDLPREFIQEDVTAAGTLDSDDKPTESAEGADKPQEVETPTEQLETSENGRMGAKEAKPAEEVKAVQLIRQEMDNARQLLKGE